MNNILCKKANAKKLCDGKAFKKILNNKENFKHKNCQRGLNSRSNKLPFVSFIKRLSHEPCIYDTTLYIHFHGQSQPSVEECSMKITTVLCESTRR